MLRMPKTIISDTSCLIILTNIGKLDLLYQTYGRIITTPDIATEYNETLPEWIDIKSATDKYYQQILEMQIDKGEASAIALALELTDSVIILDDYKARKVAEKLGLTITGTIGVIIKAKLQGIIPSIKPYLDKIKTTDFRLSVDLELRAINEAGE
jgi:predicted nucleic acid-binding protein